MLADQLSNLVYFNLAETAGTLQLYWIEPELCDFLFPLDMNVRRFTSIE
jgi:hypothetical protein